MRFSLWIILLAYILDLLLGDPQWFPHPVRLIGRFISFWQNLLRQAFASPFELKAAGVFLAVFTCSVTLAVSYLLILGAGALHWAVGLIVSVLLAYFTLATRDLHVETKKVLTSLESGDLPRARRELSYLVGRDTGNLDEPEILRALVETVAENISDGVIAPLFYLGLGGPAWAMTYKAVNTLDSMVGYKNEQFRHIGWASARLDDFVNFIPARLSGFLIALSAFVLGRSGSDALRILMRDHGKHESPNSAWSEAAMAGALGLRLGGVNYYFGQRDLKPFIGDAKKEFEIRDVRRAWKLLYLSSVGMLLISLGLAWLLGKIF
jgi:adenosylcobinamide-phosphate synthase